MPISKGRRVEDQAPIITRRPVNLENIVVTVQPPSSSTQNILSLQSCFVGREYELEAIEQHFKDPSCRLLTLVGPGGIGKTRLALEAAQRIAHFHNANVVYLQALTSPEFIITTIAETLGLHFYSGNEPRQQLLDYLGKSSMLLVLDNFEHLLDGVELLTDILEAAPNVWLLVTSRERLNLREEWVLDLGGLPYPTHEAGIQINEFDAIRLFMQHARKAKADFVLTDNLQPIITRICRLLGGMPLGIELAASWVRVLPCESIAKEIERSLDILETSVRNIHPRHRNMRAVFGPTWERLTDGERFVFAQLSVFRGGFTREAAEQVAGASLRTLTTLVDKSLLRVNANGRYDLHELLRQYGEEQLRLTSSMVEQTNDHHCQYYAQFLERCRSRFSGNQIKEVFTEIETELDNIRVAWEWAINKQKTTEIEMSLDSLWFFFDERGRYLEGEQTFARAAAIFNENSQDSITTRTKIQVRQGSLCHSLDLFDKGSSLLRESIEILRHVGARRDLALALRGLAVLLSDNNLNSCEVADYLEESLAIFAELNDHWNLAHIFNRLSIFHHREFSRRGLLEGTLERAEECAWQCLALYQQLGSPWGTAAAFLNLADVAFLHGEYEKCKHYAHESLSFFHEFGNLWGETCCFSLMGEAACKHGAYDESRWYTWQAFQFLDQFHFPAINFFSLFYIDMVIQIWMGEGEKEKAHELIGLLYQQWQKAGVNLKQHPAFKYLSRLETNLPPHLAAAVERGRQADAEMMMKSIIANFSQSTADRPAPMKQKVLLEILSERELQILQLVAEGCSNQEIADRLYIGVSTVKKHINHIYDKLNAKNRTQAVAFAREQHLLGG